MLKRVDNLEKGPAITGYSYMNADDEVESVSTPDVDGICTISLEGPQGPIKSYVFHYDIPNLIKALQAAYDHKEA